MSAADEGRTEKATSKQKEKFRNEGQVPKSVELNSLAQYVVGYVLLSAGGMLAFNLLAEIMTQSFQQVRFNGLGSQWGTFQIEIAIKTILLLTPPLLALFLSVILINVAQFGFNVSADPLKPKWGKLNAFANLKNVLISPRAFMELGKSLAKILILSYLVWLVFEDVAEEFTMLSSLSSWNIGIAIWGYAARIWVYFILFMLTLGLIDGAYQRYQLNEKMKMTPDQVKDEMKQSEGDPKVKSRQRQKAMQFFKQVMAQNIRQAQVVITNPTHYAIALQYQPGSLGAPKVVAKGSDYLAMRIRKIARQHQIPIVENRPLARGLFFQCEVGSEIPNTYFRPVAEILAWIFKLNKQRGA
ncbi:MAG: flagellar biosynthesis protein FlhB [Acidobacteria bacterium]|nr:flagellar biosynthesis protein FlhB [Acidobacteriota bacterium]